MAFGELLYGGLDGAAKWLANESCGVTHPRIPENALVAGNMWVVAEEPLFAFKLLCRSRKRP